jgi:SAM-dependent methyltransferase
MSAHAVELCGMKARSNCPVCAQPAAVIFSRPYHLPELQALVARAGLGQLVADKPYQVRYCAVTDLYFQTWVMDEAELPGWYSPSASAATFQAEIGRQKLHWFAHQTEEILVMRQLCPAPVPVVLDFGCNWGKWASMALAHGCEVYGVEVNREAAAFCAQRGIKMVEFRRLPELRFDFINVDQVVEHLSEPLKIARQLSQSLNPGGFLKMSTPDNRALPRLLAHAQRNGDNGVLNPRTLDPLRPLEHVNLFNHRSLKNLARAVGLEPFRPPFFKWFGAGQLWNVPRQLNRNLVVPFKRWLGRSSYQWFRKPPHP